MPCRVGITTNPEQRKAFWESRVAGLANWRILATYPTRPEAQAHENVYARQNNCQASQGGARARGPWHVYRFDYTHVKS